MVIIPQELINTTVCGIIAQDALFDKDYLFSWYSMLFVTREPAELADENSV